MFFFQFLLQKDKCNFSGRCIVRHRQLYRCTKNAIKNVFTVNLYKKLLGEKDYLECGFVTWSI